LPATASGLLPDVAGEPQGSYSALVEKYEKLEKEHAEQKGKVNLKYILILISLTDINTNQGKQIATLGMGYC